MSRQDSLEKRGNLDARLAAYLSAAGGVAICACGDAEGAVVGNSSVIPFGINSETNIDFNSDGQVDFQIDHDRVNLGGNNLDYLQIDKNDVNGETNPLAFDPQPNIDLTASTFPPNNTTPNNQTDAAYVTVSQGSYPSALQLGDPIGPGSTFDWQEGDNFNGTGKWIRANRLIDEDQTQIDQQLGGRTPAGVMVPTDGPNWDGLNGQVRYVGLKMHLNGAAAANPQYGWIGVRIDNEADATGAVVGWGYETELGIGILAGDTGPFTPNADFDDDGDVDGADFLLWQRQNGTTVAAGTGADGNGDTQVNGADLTLWRTNFGSAVAAASPGVGAVPEPAGLVLGGLSGILLLAWCVLTRRVRRPARLV